MRQLARLILLVFMGLLNIAAVAGCPVHTPLPAPIETPTAAPPGPAPAPSAIPPVLR